MPTPNTTLTALVSVTPILPPVTQGQTSAISVDTTVLPYTVLADVNTSQIEVLAYSAITYNKTSTVVNGQNQFTGTITIDQSQGDFTIQIIGRNYDPTAPSWTSGTNYIVGYRLVDPNGYVQIVTTAGTSGTSQPTFSATQGATTPDGTTLVWTNIGYIAITPTLKYLIIPYISGSGALIGPPSAVSCYKAQTVCRIEWLMPTYVGTVGTRVLLSTDPQGLNPPFVQYGDIVPPSQLSRSDVSVLATNVTTAFDGTGGTQTTTTVNTIQQNNYNYIDVPQTDIAGADVFYAMISTVVQDPSTQAIFESQQTGPITCGFVNLKIVQLTDFLALQRKEDIAGRMISQVNRNYPNLDLSPRSELRDLMIDPVSIELANMSVREWFSRVSQSVSALSQVDNASGNGISDPFNSSPVKQQLSRAYGMNANDTQTFIDNQFDVLGERAGIVRIGATASVVDITFYTYVKPTASVTFPLGLTISTVADSQTPALNFITTGSSSFSANSASSYYDPINGWWATTVAASCTSTGSNTNVGAGTINNATSGVPSGWYCTNLTAAAFGQDDEINSSFAARILNRLITGVDSGTRNGYLSAALATPGIVEAIIVAAGDTEMVRDWDYLRQKHVYGCVDIYTRGNTFSEQDEIVGFQYLNSGTPEILSSWIVLPTPNNLKFTLSQLNYPYPLYQAIQLAATRTTGATTIYLGLTNSQIDTTDGYLILNGNDMAYTLVTNPSDTTGVSQVRIPYLTNSAALATLTGKASGKVTYQLLARYQSPLSDSPAFQPVVSVNSVVGQPNQTGTVDNSLIDLVHTSDFLLNGGSNQAGDMVNVSTTTTTPKTRTITAIIGTPVTIDSAINVTINANGVPGDVVSVRSTDQSTLYVYGTDYTITVQGSYHTYGILPLVVSPVVTGMQIQNNVVTVYCNNKFGVGTPVTVNTLIDNTPSTNTLAGYFPSQSVLTVSSSNGTSFTAPVTLTGVNTGLIGVTSGTVSGSAIQNNQQILVTYNKFAVAENLTFVSAEAQTLTGTAFSTLDNQGFVYNTWLPESYGNTTLTLDGAVYTYAADGTTITGINTTASTGLIGALIPHDSRYIKVTWTPPPTNSTPNPTPIVMVENQDYVLTVDAVSGTAAIARSAANIGTTRIPNGGVVAVSYFITEAFTFATEYPAFVEILANKIATTKHAAADVLVKAMVANPVDITMTVVLQASATADTIDPIIRSTIDLVLDNADTTLYQSELVQQVMGVTGVQTVNLPLIKCAKSDGSYNIGVVIPTSTAWTPMVSDPLFSNLSLGVPANSYITSNIVLADSTLPSGGLAEAFVGFLYQGQAYARTYSIADFIANAVTPQPAAGLPLMSSSGSFYIIGTSDKIVYTNASGVLSTVPVPQSYWGKVLITVPKGVTNPSLYSFFVTYQVYGEGTASDITLSSTEYITPGRITINYITGS